MKYNAVKILLSTAASLLILINIVSCASLNESECQTANWEVIGLEDGSQGRPTSYIGEHRRACAEYKIAPDLTAYLKGHAQGLRQFCTEQNGFQQGFQGRANSQQCPADLASGFQRGYQKGYQAFQINSEINRLRHGIDSDQARLADIDDIKRAKEEELVRNTTREYRRRELLEEIKELERETESLHARIENMRVGLLKLEDDYQRFMGQGQGAGAHH
jgi:uncharacterized protein DUF2799